MANEKPGIMITKCDNPQHIAGTVKAARAAGYPVMIFMTDEGVRFTKDPGFLELLKVDGVDISVCDHSCERGMPAQAFPGIFGQAGKSGKPRMFTGAHEYRRAPAG